MSESESSEPSEPASDAAAESSDISAAIVTALGERNAGASALRRSVAEYVNARKALGARPEEVVIELKALVSRATLTDPWAGARLDDAAEDIATRVVRMAIEAYFPD